MSGAAAENNEFVVCVEGDIVRTSNMLRQAAVLNGGLIYAARGAAYGGIHTGQRRAGRDLLSTRSRPRHACGQGRDRVRATIDFLGGELLVEGEVVSNDVTYGGGFDLGRMVVRGGQGEATLGVYNEFMTADIDGRRAATFPDMIGTLDRETGDVVSISESRRARASLSSSPSDEFPVGKGALDPAVFPEVEQAMGVDLRSYL